VRVRKEGGRGGMEGGLGWRGGGGPRLSVLSFLHPGWCGISQED